MVTSNMLEKIKNNYYENIIVYPQKTKPHCPGCQLPILSKANFCFNCGHDIKKLVEDHQANYKTAVKEYRENGRRLMAEFKKDLLAEHGLTNHPKAEKIYDYVWDLHHSSGLYAVYEGMNEIYELFKE